jgi:hypothetical protein
MKNAPICHAGSLVANFGELISVPVWVEKDCSFNEFTLCFSFLFAKLEILSIEKADILKGEVGWDIVEKSSTPYKHTLLVKYSQKEEVIVKEDKVLFNIVCKYVENVNPRCALEVVNMVAANLTATNYPALPVAGVWLDVNTRWNDGGALVQVRQAHFRTADPVANIPALFSVFRTDTGSLTWTANEAVILGSIRYHATIKYKCIQPHVTQLGWEPNITPALWVVVPSSNNWTAGVAYKVNDLVVYVPNTFTYKCLQAHTAIVSWEPPSVPALWQKQ